MKTMIEVMSGCKRMASAFKKAGYKVLTIDIEKKFKPDIVADFMQMELKDIPKEFRKPTVAWFSPVCTVFSLAACYRYWDDKGRQKSWKTYYYQGMAMKCVEWMRIMDPEYGFIENPRGLLRKQPFMKGIDRKTVTYCQYGMDYMKPTDIFCFNKASSWVPRKMCSNGDVCHESAQRGADRGLQAQHRSSYDRSKVPKELCQELVALCEGKIEKQERLLEVDS